MGQFIKKITGLKISSVNDLQIVFFWLTLFGFFVTMGFILFA